MIEKGLKLDGGTLADVARRREVFKSDAGRKVLADILLSAGVFEKIDPSDAEAIAVRNFAIDIMDSMCMVQEGELDRLLLSMLLSPLPDEIEEEEGPNMGF